MFLQTLAGGQCTSASDPATGVLTSTGASTVGNRLVIGISGTASTSTPPTVVDSKGHTYTKVSASTVSIPCVGIYVATCVTPLEVGDTVDISGWSIGTRNYTLVWDEVTPGVVNKNVIVRANATSSTPSGSITSTLDSEDIIGCIGFASSVGDTLTYTPDGSGYEIGGFRQHTGASNSVHLVYRQGVAPGTYIYQPTPLDGLSAPLSKAWQICQSSLGSPVSSQSLRVSTLMLLGAG